MKLHFDHTYSADPGFRFRNKLGKAGFVLGDAMTEHPGKAFCRFIILQAGPTAPRHYLEFVHIGRGGNQTRQQGGLSFGAATGLEQLSARLIKNRIGAEFAHKNYEWKINSTDRLPGWNFVTFPKHKSNVFTWLTEYESSKKRKKKKLKDSRHPNQVQRLIAMEVDLNPKDLRLYRAICGRSKGNVFHLSCGTILRVTKAKRSSLRSAVVTTKDLGRLVKRFVWDELTTYQGQPAVRIKNPNPKMWDVVIVQEKV